MTTITPTGDREICMRLSVRWMSLQTLKPSKWIIIDDGKIPLSNIFIDSLPPYSLYIRREPNLDDPKHTLNTNMMIALMEVESSKVVIWEDDEYYAPRYLSVMDEMLDKGDVVGIGYARYYHLPSGGYARHNNIAHASFAQTAFRSSMVSQVIDCINKKDPDNYLDILLWNSIGGKMRGGTGLEREGRKIGSCGLLFDDMDRFLYVGMKGMPGRVGIGMGHKQSWYTNFDLKRRILRQWIPLHFRSYLDILRCITTQ